MIPFTHTIGDDLNLSNFRNQALFYLPKMEFLEIEEIKFSFRLKSYTIEILITNLPFNKNKCLNLRIIATYDKKIPVSNSQIGIFNIDDTGHAQICISNDNEIVDQISLLVKCLYKIDKLQVFL